MVRTARWTGGLAWAAAGALLGLGLAAIASIGALLLVTGAALAVALAVRDVPGWPAALLGVGAAFAVIGAASLPWQACPEVTPTVVAAPGEPGERYECGGLHPAVWFGVALAAGAGALGAARSAR